MVTLDTIASTQEHHSEILEKIDITLRGDGEKIGMIGRIDRLEQDAIKRTWHFRAVWTAIVTAVLSVLSH